MLIKNVNMPNFMPDEYPFGELEHMSPDILQATQWYRTSLKAKVSISLAEGSQARLTGRKTSEHFVSFEKGYESTATDIFPNTHIFKAWSVAVNAPYIHRVGVYFDTNGNDGKFHPMLHLGLKKDNLLWYRINKNEYHYSTEPDFYIKLLKLFNEFRLVEGIKL